MGGGSSSLKAQVVVPEKEEGKLKLLKFTLPLQDKDSETIAGMAALFESDVPITSVTIQTESGEYVPSEKNALDFINRIRKPKTDKNADLVINMTEIKRTLTNTATPKTQAFAPPRPNAITISTLVLGIRFGVDSSYEYLTVEDSVRLFAMHVCFIMQTLNIKCGELRFTENMEKEHCEIIKKIIIG